MKQGFNTKKLCSLVYIRIHLINHIDRVSRYLDALTVGITLMGMDRKVSGTKQEDKLPEFFCQEMSLKGNSSFMCIFPEERNKWHGFR